MDQRRELELLLLEPLDQALFRSVCALLERWSGDDVEAAIERAEQVMETWPLETRAAPWSWGRSLLAGETKKTWRLVCGIETNPGWLGRKPVKLASIVERPELAHLSRFELDASREMNELGIFAENAHRWSPKEVLIVGDRYSGKAKKHQDLSLWGELEELHFEKISNTTIGDELTSFLPSIDESSSLRAVTLRADDLVALLDRAHLPALREINVWILDTRQARELAERPELEKIETLRLAFRCKEERELNEIPYGPTLGTIIPASDEAAEVFFARARLSALRHLELFGKSSEAYWERKGPGPRTIDALLRSEALASIRHLSLDHMPLGDAGLKNLLKALPDSLRSLELIDLFAKDETALALAESPVTPNLERLLLEGNLIGSKGFEALAAVSFTRLRELDISGPTCQPYYFRFSEQPVGDEGLAAWIGSSAMSTLKALSMAGARLTDKGLSALADCEDLRLERLDFAHNQATAEGLKALVKSGLWTTLRELSFRDCLLDDAAIGALTEVADAPHLRKIDLSHNTIGAAGAKSLAAWSVLSQVRSLNLHDNVLGDDGVAALARSENLGRLLELDIQQDVWNLRRQREHDATALSESSAFGGLDTIRSGVIDAYHWCAWSRGFSDEGLKSLRIAPGLRPEARASLAEDAFEIQVAQEVDPETKKLLESDFMKQREIERDFRNQPRPCPEEDYLSKSL